MINYLCLLLAFFLIACTQLQSSKSAPTPSEIPVQTDRSTLGSQINLPKNISNAKWIVLAPGISRNDTPGPTDTILYALLENKNKDWSSLPKTKQSLTSKDIVELPVQVASKLLSSDTLKKFPQADGYVKITGKQYEASIFNKGSYRGSYAIVVDGNLLVCLQTM